MSVLVKSNPVSTDILRFLILKVLQKSLQLKNLFNCYQHYNINNLQTENLSLQISLFTVCITSMRSRGLIRHFLKSP